MKKLRLQSLLMVITIVGVTGFQAFWLRQTYEQEKKTLLIKTDIAFRDAIQDLQVVKLKLDSIPGDSTKLTKIKRVINDSVDERISIQSDNKKGIVSTINVIRRGIKDSFVNDQQFKNGVFVTKEETTFDHKLDLLPGMVAADKDKPNRNLVFRFLYDVDLAQDSLKLNEIDSALGKTLQHEKINIPFSVSKLDSNYKNHGPEMGVVSVGFAHPSSYKLQPGNTFPYLLKQISLPILFSVLLLAITIISFVMLYKNLLQQRRLTAIKNEFIGNITHELKTPIATVSVAIEALKNFNALQNPERTEEYLGIADTELNRLSMLVDKVLRLSMFENKQVELKFQPFDLSELIREVLRSMQLQFEKSNADVALELKGIDFSLEADKMHLTSVLYNLLDNALKYSKEKPAIRLTLESNSNGIILSVADKGIGIDPAYTHKIFDKFFRVPHGNMHNVKGYGLGLSYAAHIVERHDGTIQAESDGNSGTTFIIKLPRRHAD